jgi:uncharacterized membrane protein YfcA
VDQLIRHNRGLSELGCGASVLLLTFLLYVFVGSLAGILAGLFGVGGGVIIVPVLIFAFAASGIPAELLTQMAIGTSLATIVLTSINSAWAHHRLGNVDWKIFWLLAPGVAIGVYFGAEIAARVSGNALQLGFGIFGLFVAAQMGLGIQPKSSRSLPGAIPLFSVGTVFGCLSGLFGIGGGSLTVPFLNWCNLTMQRAVAISAACGIPIALIGSISYIYVGWQREGLPELSTGFVYWPAFVGIGLAAAPMARVGAQLAQRLPGGKLRRLFAIFLLCVSIQFIYRNI